MGESVKYRIIFPRVLDDVCLHGKIRALPTLWHGRVTRGRLTAEICRMLGVSALGSIHCRWFPLRLVMVT